jgi:hypothetical protein
VNSRLQTAALWAEVFVGITSIVATAIAIVSLCLLSRQLADEQKRYEATRADEQKKHEETRVDEQRRYEETRAEDRRKYDESLALERKRYEEARALERRPFLAFETGTTALNVVSLGVLNDGDLRKIEGSTQRNAMQYVKPFGALVNYGKGPALDVKVTWRIDPVANTTEPHFNESVNVLRPEPMIVLPGSKGSLVTLPAFAVKDDTTVGRFYYGTLAIEYRDASLKAFVTQQRFEIHFRPDDPNKLTKGTLNVTFQNLVGLGD